MTFTFTTGLVSRYLNGELGVLINIPNVSDEVLEQLSKIMEDEKVKTVEIDYFKEKRSHNANSMMWSLLNKLAAKLGTTDEELYIDYLRKYAPKDYMAAPKEAEEIFKTLYKIVEPVRDCTINETPAVTFRCIRGSSKFNRKEFSILLDHVVRDCKEQGIQTLEAERINEIIERWKPE